MRSVWIWVVTAAVLVAGVVVWISRTNDHVIGDGVAKFKSDYVDLGEGDRLCLPENLNEGVSRRGKVIIVVGAKCPVCSASKSFDDRVDEEFRARGVPVYFALSDDHANDQAETEFRMMGRQVIREPLRKLGTTRIPTVLRLNNDGKIVSMWTGWVAPASEKTVLNALESGSSLEHYVTVREDEVPKYARRAGAIVLSLSFDGARNGASSKVIPANELATRAQYELARDHLIVVDCGTVRAALACQESILHLVRMKYNAVAAGLPRNSTSCKSGS